MMQLHQSCVLHGKDRARGCMRLQCVYLKRKGLITPYIERATGSERVNASVLSFLCTALHHEHIDTPQPIIILKKGREKSAYRVHFSNYLTSRRLPTMVARFEPKLGHFGFVVDKVAPWQVFSKYFGLPCQFLFHRLLHIHDLLSAGAGTIGQLVADVPSELSLIPP
jgi:hypothetical protein